MTKRKMITLVACVFAVVIIAVCVALPFLQIHRNTNVYIFSDISECNALEELSVTDGHFTRYQNTTQDSNLQGLQYAAFFAGKYSCEQYTFEIYAYEFTEPAAAKTYFENATGKNTNELDSNFSLASGMTTSHIIAFHKNMAYAVYCPSNDLSDVSMVLAEYFQNKIK